MLSANDYQRHAVHIRSLSFFLGLITTITLMSCGANDTTTPVLGKYYPASEKLAIKGEYFIGVHPASMTSSKEDPMDTIYRFIATLPSLPKASGNQSDSSMGVVGCGGLSDVNSYKDTRNSIFCVKLQDPENDVPALLKHELVRYVEQNSYMVASGVQVCPPDGLDQIDQKHGIASNGVFSYQYSGKGVDVYVVDTGIGRRLTQESLKKVPTSDEFNADFDSEFDCEITDISMTPFTRNANCRISKDGRYLANVDSGMMMLSLKLRNGFADDCVGHGSRLAAIVAGKHFGVAKSATVHSIRVAGYDSKPITDNAPEPTCPSVVSQCKNEEDILVPASELKTALDKLYDEFENDPNGYVINDPSSKECMVNDCSIINNRYFPDRKTASDPKACMAKMCMMTELTVPRLLLVPWNKDGIGSPTLKAPIDNLVDLKGAVLIVSAGNKSDDAGLYSPSGLSNVITVAALNENGNFAKAFSNYGAAVEVLAPGTDVATTLPMVLRKTCPTRFSGTSASAAYVTGVAAQIMEANYERILTKSVAPRRAILDAIGRFANQPSGIGGLPSGTPDNALRSPYGSGITNGDHEATSSNIDGCIDTVSFESCPANMSCQTKGFCNSIAPGCNVPLKDSETTRGVSCTDGACTSCGLKGEICCGVNSCGKNLDCLLGLCKCGGNTQSCCNGSDCDDGLSCNKGKCEPCGWQDKICCKGATCYGGPRFLICDRTEPSEPKFCKICGQKANAPCCDGALCLKSDLTCGTESKCIKCGTVGESCCAGSTCNDPALTCGPDGKCTPCGTVGKACCAGSTCHDSSLTCGADGTCKKCGGMNDQCCATGTACRGEQICDTGNTCRGRPCHVRCKYGEEINAGPQVTDTDCREAGKAKCGACGTDNELVRARFNGRLVFEERANCGKAGQACCADPMFPNAESLANICPMGTSCKHPSITARCTGDGDSATCQ